MHVGERGVGGVIGIDHGDAASIAGQFIKRIERRRIVEAVEARLHDHKSRNAMRRAAAFQFIERCETCEISPLRHLRVAADGTDDVNVGIAAH